MRVQCHLGIWSGHSLIDLGLDPHDEAGVQRGSLGLPHPLGLLAPGAQLRDSGTQHERAGSLARPLRRQLPGDPCHRRDIVHRQIGNCLCLTGLVQVVHRRQQQPSAIPGRLDEGLVCARPDLDVGDEVVAQVV